MNFPNLSALTGPVKLQDLGTPSLKELQIALARTAYPIRVIDGLYGRNTSTCWAAFLADSGPGDPTLVTPDGVAVITQKISALETIEAKPQATPEQVIAAIIAECNALGLSLRAQHAYVVATTYWETAHTFQPVEEAFYLKDAETYRKTLAYYPFFGRGYVQLTWKNNYTRYAEILQNTLATDFFLALEPAIALFVLVHGFKTGTFTQHKLTEFVDGTKVDFVGARRCINGSDHAADIATIAEGYMKTLPH